jgi:hypothetical protein
MDNQPQTYAGDLLKLNLGEEEYIVHQANCQSTYARGLAQHLFRVYPEANTYNPTFTRVPGTISVHGPIINMYAQDTPGKTRSNNQRDKRLEWFQNGLDEIGDQLLDAKKIYFPYKIGCGMAGGNWVDYLKMIQDWTKTMEFEVHILIPPGE